MKRPIENALWCDCGTDEERIAFLRSGRAWATGAIAPPLVDAMVGLFERVRNAEARVEELEETVDRLQVEVNRSFVHFGVAPSDWCGDVKSAAQALITWTSDRGDDPPERGTVAEAFRDMKAQRDALEAACRDALAACRQVERQQGEGPVPILRAALAWREEGECGDERLATLRANQEQDEGIEEYLGPRDEDAEP